MPPYLLHHTFQVLMHRSVIETNQPDIQTSQEFGSLSVMLGTAIVIMALPVHFDAEFLSRAVEIEDVRPCTMLSPELAPFKLSVL